MGAQVLRDFLRAGLAEPDNADLQRLAWSGRGKTPTWLRAQIEGGKTADEFRV